MRSIGFQLVWQQRCKARQPYKKSHKNNHILYFHLWYMQIFRSTVPTPHVCIIGHALWPLWWLNTHVCTSSSGVCWWLNPNQSVVKSVRHCILAMRTVLWSLFEKASVYLSDAQGLKPFYYSETAGISVRWERWLRAFELFSAGKVVRNVDPKKALLLIMPDWMCRIFISRCPKKEDRISIRKQRRRWINISNRKRMFRMKGFVFVKKSQLANETVEQFVTRLSQNAQACEFGDAATVDEQIRDQVS